MAAASIPPVLVNCTGDDVHVLVNGTPRLLATGAVPAVLHGPARPFSMPVTVQDPDVADGPGDTISLLVYAQIHTYGVLSLPPYTPGVWCLVDADAVRRFPWRHDFVTAAAYEHVPGPDGSDVAVLHGVTRAVDPVVEQGAAPIEDM